MSKRGILSSQASLQRLGVQVCGLFVEVEEEKFAARLDDLLPLLEREMSPDNYEDVSHLPSGPASSNPWVGAQLIDYVIFQIEEEQEEKGADRLLFNVLTLISKLNTHCSLLELSTPHDTLCNIWGKENTSVTFLHTHTQSYT